MALSMASKESGESAGKSSSSTMTQQAEDDKRDKVNVYLIVPTENVVNPSPPCLKLETFLRMVKIPYNPIRGWKPSTKGKMPWIEYQGKDVADSNFSIQYLSKEFGVDVDEHLNAEQKAVATAFHVMLEENTYWTYAYNAWLTSHGNKARERLLQGYATIMQYVLLKLIQRNIRGYLYGHGIGRHTEEELYGIAERDLRAVSAYLGEKRFLFGDKPCLTDATLFGIVAPFIWEMPQSPQGVLMTKELTNLAEHAQRMKEMYFPDWNEIVAKPASE